MNKRGSDEGDGPATYLLTEGDPGDGEGCVVDDGVVDAQAVDESVEDEAVGCEPRVVEVGEARYVLGTTP